MILWSHENRNILIQAAIFRLISGGNRNAMLFDHFLTPHPNPHHRGTAERESEYSRSAGKREYVFSLRRPRRRGGGDDGDGAGHKNACLNENVLLAPFAQLGRLFCLLEPRPTASSLGDRKAVLASQRVREYYIFVF